MHKINVFISYCHKNRELREEIVQILSNEKDIEVYYDEKDIPVGHGIHEKISAMLDFSDIVIAIATKEWLNSTETREEFTRSHERRKHLICFADESTNLEHLPQFIRDAKQIRFSPNQKNTAINNLIPAIHKFAQTNYFPRQRIYRRLKEIGDEVHRSNTEFYRINLAYDHIEQALDETQNILGHGPYSIDIGNENGYLLKAISIFESASKIYAVSLVGISTFWADKTYTDKAIQYLERQSKDKLKIVRLFVFANCTQVNEYKNILQANHIAYGENNKGAVLMCSKKTYERFIVEVGRNNWFSNVFDDDFGILAYSDNDREPHFIEARLDNNVFKFRPIALNHVSAAGIKRFITKFEEIDKQLKNGELLNDFKIIRWDPVFINSPEEFAPILKTMFDENEEVESILHLAIFTKCYSRTVSEGLFELVNKLKSFNGRFFNFKKIDLLVKTKMRAFDAKFGTELLFNEDIDYIMIMEFPNEKSLKEYYSHTEHSNEREKIYSIINPRVVEYYNRLKTLNRYDGNYRIKSGEIYEQIESMMAAYFCRLDFRNLEIAELIVRQKGIPFANLNF